MDLMLTVVDNLVDKGVRDDELPKYITAFYILRSEAMSAESVKELLVSSAKEIGLLSKS